jgi:hypothetical protein
LILMQSDAATLVGVASLAPSARRPDRRPPRLYDKGTFGQHPNWSDLKPIHSDHWGQ